MIPPEDVVAAFLAGTTDVYRRVDIYEQDGATPFYLDAPVIDGAVSVDYGRGDRRNFDLTLNNSSGAFRHAPDGLWYDKIFKIFRGCYPYGLQGPPYSVPLGVFMVDDARSQDFPDSIAVKGKDYAKKLMEDKFVLTTTFTKGEKIEDVIRVIATNGGVHSFAFPATEEALTSDATFEKGSSRWDAISTIATSYSLEVYFGPTGSLVLREFQDPSTAPPVFTFETGEPNGSLIRWSKSSSDARIFNSVSVYGDVSPETALPVYATVENRNPNSPTSIQNLGRVKSAPEYTTVLATSVDQCRQIATDMLAVSSLEEFNVELEALCLPWLEAGEVVCFDPGVEEAASFLMTSFTVPLRLGSMSPTAKRVFIV